MDTNSESIREQFDTNYRKRSRTTDCTDDTDFFGRKGSSSSS